MSHKITKSPDGHPLFYPAFTTALGFVSGAKPFRGMGERTNVNTTVGGEDISELIATTVPVPSPAGIQVGFTSTGSQDHAGGSGIRSFEIHYLDLAGLQQEEIIIPISSGTKLSVATDITFINDMYHLTIGSAGLASGDITAHAVGSVGIIYNKICANQNKSLVINRKVPSDHDYYITSWEGSVKGGKASKIRLRATADEEGNELTEGFNFKRTYLSGGTGNFQQIIDPPIKIIAGAQVKVTQESTVQGNDITVSFNGVLLKPPSNET